ncbi:hypothetical protein GCM10027570_52760 [Streptomonospora sediminis]
MAISDAGIRRLETAAAAGDSRAARELGRLLSLTATNPLAPSLEEGPTWPEERWLRAAVQAHPDDIEALTLLAGRLVQQVSHGENGLDPDPHGAADSGADEAAGPVERRRAEAQELLARIRAVGPGGAAEAGLQELAVRLGMSEEPPAENGYSFHLLTDEVGSGSMLYLATIVASDPDEFRWACDTWRSLSEVTGFDEPPVLVTYVDGAVVSSICLGPCLTGHGVDWSAVTVPELTGTRLPAGLPVPGTPAELPVPGRCLHYGFSMSLH